MGVGDRASGERMAVGRPAGGFVARVAAALPSQVWAMPAVVAVSGGADSVALLLAVVAAAPAAALGRLVVAHAEHDLRPEAPVDRAFVTDLATSRGLRCVWRRVSVSDADADGEGLEGRARRRRYAFLADAAGELGARHVIVAHTADDQAETILHRMLRGTGLAGLGGMQPVRELTPGISLVRPLLSISRADVRAFLEEQGQAWREDRSNADTRHARNFLRHAVIPPCEAGPYPATVDAVVRLGRQASLVAGAIRSAAEHLLELHAMRQADGGVLLRTAALSPLDRHLLAEVFVALWRREGWPQRDMTARHYAELASLVADEDAVGRQADFPGAIRVVRQPHDHVRLTPSVARPSPPA